MQVATHSGPFHADDVMAWALVRTFFAADATLVRTRDPARIAEADMVFDVGAVYDPDRLRFDHHQNSYTGPLSSAGMVLAWLEAQGHVAPSLAALLRDRLVAYLDDVDNGRVAPDPRVPCFPSIVDALNQPASSEEDHDVWFHRAAAVAEAYLSGLVAEHDKIEEAAREIPKAMAEAEADGRNVLVLDRYLRWKPAYFAAGGADHPTEYVLFPGTDGSWRILAIPPEPASFDQKRPLPAEWAGLTGADLEAVTGIPGSVFCHKNLFIAVFTTRDGAIEALRSSGRLLRSQLA